MAIIGYTKLFNSIVTSTIWSESNTTRIVWITMLASCDKDGYVPASIPGLAHLARVGIDECKQAIETLESPDGYSRSQEFEGRRIEKVDGGWRLLNHSKYRKILSEQERREYNTRKHREYRLSTISTNVNNSPNSSITSTHTDTDTDTDTDTKTERENLALLQFQAFWTLYPRQLDQDLAKQKFLSLSLIDQQKAVECLPGWIGSSDWQEQQYIPSPVKFLDKRRWESKPIALQKKGGVDERELERVRAARR